MGGINVLFFMLQNALLVLITPLLYRYLGHSLYGLWAIMLAIMTFAGLANFGTSTAVMKYVSQAVIGEFPDEELSKVITSASVLLIGTALLVVAAVWGTSDAVAGHIAHGTETADSLSTALRVLSFALVPLLLTQVSRGVLMGLVRNDLSGALDLAQRTLLFCGALAIGIAGQGILGLALWIFVTNVLIWMASVVLSLWALRAYQLRPLWDRSVSTGMLRFQFLVWTSTVGTTLFNAVDSIVVGIVIGPAAVAAYSICTAAALRINGLSDILTVVLVPYASGHSAAGNANAVVKAFKISLRATCCLITAITGTIIVWTVPLLSVWISPAWANRYGVSFVILMSCYAVISMSIPARQVSQGLGKLWFPAVSVLVASLVTLGLIAALASTYGVLGAAVANFAYVGVVGIVAYVAWQLRLAPLRSMVEGMGPPLVLLGLATTVSLIFTVPYLFALLETVALVVMSIVLMPHEVHEVARLRLRWIRPDRIGTLIRR